MSESKSPAFQFYPSDFLVGTANLSCTHVGAYVRLLCHQWDKGFVPSSKTIAAQVAGCSTGIAQALLRHKFPMSEDGKRRNIRLERERGKQMQFRKVQSEKGRKGAETRWNANGTGHAPAMPAPMPDDSSSSSSSSSKRIYSFTAPEMAEVKLQSAKIGLSDPEAEKFFHFYESKGWKVGKSSMKSWHSALSGWKLRCQTSQQPSTKPDDDGLAAWK